jgi:hypothetical protein
MTQRLIRLRRLIIFDKVNLMSDRNMSTSKEPAEGNMSDDDQDFLESLEKEASEFSKVSVPLRGLNIYSD